MALLDATHLLIQFDHCDWMQDANCRNYPHPDDFFPVLTGRAATGNAARARALALCAECPVIEDCREYACSINARGIWGGMTETERRISKGLKPR